MTRTLLVLPLLACACLPPAQAQSEAGLLKPAAAENLEARLGRDPEQLTHYAIDQALDDAKGQLRGRVTIRFCNPGPGALESLPLLLHPNSLADHGGGGQDTGSLQVLAARADSGPAVELTRVRPSLVELRFAEPLAAGSSCQVVVDYTGRLRVLPASVNDAFAAASASLGSISGTRAADYGLLGKGDGIVTLACAFPQVPPFTEGAFDTEGGARVGDLAYNDMASFRVRTAFPAGLTVVTNLLDGPVQDAGSGLELVSSHGELCRDLVLIAGRDLRQSERQVGGTRVRSVYRTRDAKAGALALEVAAQALASFERRFGPYPYRELEVAEASLAGGAGGVEFSGMILVAGMLYRSPDTSSSPLAVYLKVLERMDDLLDSGGTRRRKRGEEPKREVPGAELLREQLEFTVAHEVAHQYFHGIVGNDSRREAVIDEPLAQYLAGVAMRDRLGEEQGQAAFTRNVKLVYALYRTLGGADRAACRPTSTFATSIEYAALVYGKAPYLYADLERRAGADALHAAIRAGVEAHRYRVVTLGQWTATLARELPEQDVAGLVERYLKQPHGDEDLGVDDSGELVFEAMFGPAMGRTVRDGLRDLGISPRAYLRMTYGALSDEGPLGGSIDLDEALKQLEKLGRR